MGTCRVNTLARGALGQYTSPMSRTDRIVVVAALALSVVALVTSLKTAGNTGAMLGSPAVAGTPLANDLGPADAVLFNTEAGKDALRVAAKDGRLSWGDRATNRVWSVAAVDIDSVMKKILQGTSYEEKRSEAQETSKAEEAEFNKRLEELRAKFPLPTDGTAPSAEAQQAVATLQQEYNRWLEGMRRRDEKIASEQFEQAYRELVTAVEAVSEKESIDLVFRFYPTADPFEATRAGEALAQIQARTFLKYPTSIDITADVMKVLNLTE